MAIESRFKKSASVRDCSKQITTRRIVFVPPRSAVKADVDGFALPERYVVSPTEVVRLISWDKVSMRGVGLNNRGNTCYLNSVLQALTHTSALGNDAVSGSHFSRCVRKQSSIFCGYCALLTQIKSSLTCSSRMMSPDVILRHLKMLAKSMRHGRQEDSHEFLRQLLDSCLMAELPENKTVPSALVRSTTFLGQIFSGFLQSKVTCGSCGNVSRTFDPFMDLSLEIQGCSSLFDCLKKFTHADTLSGSNSYKCSKCQKRTSATKQMFVHQPSRVLTIQLKRFDIFSMKNGSAQKNNRHVAFTSELDISEFCSNSKLLPVNKYKLYSIIVHEGGSMGSGHYVCYAKAANGLWYFYNDSSVVQVSEKTVLSQTAYILFYEQEVTKTTQVCRTTSCPIDSIPEGEAQNKIPATNHTETTRVINHDSESSSDDDSVYSSECDDAEQPTICPVEEPVKPERAVRALPQVGGAMEAFCRGPLLRAVVRAKDRKVLRMLTLMKVIAKKNRHLHTPKVHTTDVNMSDVHTDVHTPTEPTVCTYTPTSPTVCTSTPTSPIECTPTPTCPTECTPTPSKGWGSIAVSTWDGESCKKFVSVVREPGARSQHDFEYEMGKSKHNPRSEFTSGNGLPPTLKNSFNQLQGGLGNGKGKGFGKGKGKGGKGFGKGKGGKGFGKGKGGFGKGKGKGFRRGE